MNFSIGKSGITEKRNVDRTFQPAMTPEVRGVKYKGWQKAVSRSRAWENSDD